MDSYSNSENLILTLLKADLCNNKLISGLEKAGLLADHFYADLETVVLILMGFDLKKREEELHNFYYDTMDRLLQIEVKAFRENLNPLAQEMYKALIAKQ